MKKLNIFYIYSILLCTTGVAEIIHYSGYNNPITSSTFVLIQAIVILCAIGGAISIPVLFYPLLTLVLGILNNFCNYWGHLVDNREILLQFVIALIASITSFFYPDKYFCKYKKVFFLLFPLIFLSLCSLGYWRYESSTARNLTSDASSNIWEVPACYDSDSSTGHSGTVEEISYQTLAYATDSRSLEKRACVYLPYDYDPSVSYNILYLMHGTGDDENYWLKTFSYNKTMIDRMIDNGDIKPLIIVTPSFYVEDDCMDDLDQLTYSFAQELRNDLMPAVESKYSTYARDCSNEGFIASRDHRAFAGLSRGAVTMYHSALCGSLDYFSWFAAFSGSRTDADYFKDHLQSDVFKDYPIHYLYVSSGTFDFALPGQLRDYQALLQTDDRLISGENTCFDVYPMRYHSIGSWHLALYNFLPKIFR